MKQNQRDAIAWVVDIIQRAMATDEFLPLLVEQQDKLFRVYRYLEPIAVDYLEGIVTETDEDAATSVQLHQLLCDAGYKNYKISCSPAKRWHRINLLLWDLLERIEKETAKCNGDV